MSRFEGFEPVFDRESRVLILGSFPSVKSRQEGFYYGNPQNRFWRMMAAFFGEEIPRTVEEKISFLHKNHVALWDMVASCEVKGSQDASIKDASAVDLRPILSAAPIEAILCNGTKSFGLLSKYFPQLLPLARKLPSTSPANPRFSAADWRAELERYFKA